MGLFVEGGSFAKKRSSLQHQIATETSKDHQKVLFLFPENTSVVCRAIVNLAFLTHILG